MTFAKTTSALLFAAVMLGAGATAASAGTPFQEQHPRRAEVIARAEHQIHRVNVERREGEISRYQAHRLRAADRHVIHQEQRMAFHHDGRITRYEQLHLNREENRIGRHIPG